jgi:hypothetical protein
VGTEIIVPTVQNSASWLHYGDATQGLQPIVVEHKWIDRNADGVRALNELVRYDANEFPPENFETGHLVEVVTASGIVNGAQRQIRTEVIRIPLIANAAAAITCDNGIDLTGNISSCGHNHLLSTPANTKIPDCYAFEKCTNRTQCSVSNCLVSVMTTGDDADTGGSSDLEGYPQWADTSSSNVFMDPNETLGLEHPIWDDILSDPDYTSANDDDVMQGIVFIDGDATGPETFNGVSGEGLIYVTGDMKITGGFTWKGLVFVEGDCEIVGDAWILGAIMVRGTTAADAFGAGNSTVLYCRDAIIMEVGAFMGFRTLAWNEQ